MPHKHWCWRFFGLTLFFFIFFVLVSVLNIVFSQNCSSPTWLLAIIIATFPPTLLRCIKHVNIKCTMCWSNIFIYCKIIYHHSVIYIYLHNHHFFVGKTELTLSHPQCGPQGWKWFSHLLDLMQFHFILVPKIL